MGCSRHILFFFFIILLNYSAAGMLEVKVVCFLAHGFLEVLIPCHSPRIQKPPEPPKSCQSHKSLLFQLLASCEVQVSAEQYKGSTNTQLISTCSATPHWCCHYYRSWYCQEDGYY